jgi:hypothetical protein
MTSGAIAREAAPHDCDLNSWPLFGKNSISDMLMLPHPATKADAVINSTNVIAGRNERTKLKSPALIPLTIGILRRPGGNRQALAFANLNDEQRLRFRLFAASGHFRQAANK